MPTSFIRGLLDDQEDPQLPQYDPEGGWNTAKWLGQRTAALTGPGGIADAFGLLGEPSVADQARQGDYFGAGMTALGALPLLGVVAKGAKAARGASKVAKAAPIKPTKAAGLLGDEGVAALKDRLTGRTAYGPETDLVFNGKSPHEFSPEDWGAFGREHGVENLGPASNADFEGSLVSYPTKSGGSFTVPGGIEDVSKPFSYYDLLHLKAQGIDPNDIEPDIHRQLHNRMMTTMSPAGPVSDERLFNQYLMGITSPNNGLTNNEFAVAGMMAKEGDNSIGRMAGMTPWKSLDDMPPADASGLAQRKAVSKNITSAYGLQEGSRGGLGNSGSQDYTRVSDLAKMFQENPDWFRFRGAGEGGSSPSENWLNLVNRVSSQVPGLKPKTASFSTVWQNPKDASISAIDRHMATELNGALFTNPEEERAFEKKVVNYFNLNRPKEKQLEGYQDVMSSPGGRGAFVEQAMQEVNKHGEPKYRLKSGEINPNIPEQYKTQDWVKEPSNVLTVSPGYLRALAENDRLARENNQGLFANQWMLWDRIRKRMEPHEIMYPGLEKLPRMSQGQLKNAFGLHTQLGYQNSPAQVRQTANPSSLSYFGLGGAIPLGLLSQYQDENQTGL